MTENSKENIPEQRSNKPVFVDRRILRSQAFKELGGTATKVLLVFLSKRQVQQIKTSKRQFWADTNRGEITFTYREAEKKYGISRHAFYRAVTELMDLGFVDIYEPGVEYARVSTKYGISDRWENYGKPGFVPVKRVSRPAFRHEKAEFAAHDHKARKTS